MTDEKTKEPITFPWQALPAIVFLCLLLGLAIWNLLAPSRDFSDVENRKLATYPEATVETVRSGRWMSQFETYAADQFIFRDQWMQMNTALNFMMLRRDNGRVWYGKQGYLFPMEAPDMAQEAANLQLMTDWLARISGENQGLRLSVLLAPTAHSVLREYLPAHAVIPGEEETTALKYARDFIETTQPEVVVTDALDALLQAHEEDPQRQLYYRTDHHWTSEGAYIAYCQWAKDNDFQPFAADSFHRIQESSSFLGTTWSKAPEPTIEPDIIQRYQPKSNPQYEVTAWLDAADPSNVQQRDSLYQEDFLKKKDQYSYFLGGNDPQILIRTPVHNGRKLLLIKDSYANCMVPFLALHYEEIWITDLRYSHGKLLPLPGTSTSGETNPMDVSDFTDALFLYNIQSFSTDRNLAWLSQLLP